MTALAFACLIACLFGALALWESPAGAGVLRPQGLGRWLVSGNWPAKVGAGLLVIGTGALIRYALQNIDMPPPLKLGSGLALAALLAAGALALRGRPALRAVHIALTGAALGICYLTAYAAYGFFAYVTDVQALALLALVAAAGGAFAVAARAQSVAVLAMTGAWLAPAFALGAPGPLQVYGYYLAVALLSAVMIRLRGWRALIHLSFLFTLGGALFFGWTRGFYQPVHYPLMQPLLLALAAVHLALPLLERSALTGRWLPQADRLYAALLPLAGALLTLAIAPRADVEGALGLALLSGLWSGAALWLTWRRQAGAPAHFAVAALLLAGAALLAFADLPWLLLAMAAAVALLWLAPTLGGRADRSELLTLVLAALGVAHGVAELLDPGHGPAFLHAGFAERLLGAALLGAGAWAAARRGVAYAMPVGVLAGAWGAIAVALELIKLHLADLPLYALALAVAGTLGHAAWLRRRPATTGALLVMLTLLFGAALWAAAAADRAPWLPLAATVIAAAALALATQANRTTAEPVTALALGGIAAVALPWLLAVDRLPGTTPPWLALVLLAPTALAFLLALRTDSPTWRASLAPLLGGVAGLLLLALAMFHIERSVAGVLAELAALAVLVLAALTQAPDRRRDALGAPFALAALLGAALMLQAAVLRAFGPPREVLTLADLAAMRLPSVVSLMWAALGAALCVWAGRAQRRGAWLAGATLLVVAAAKVVLLDFDDLGQLGNIVAVIAAGLVFLAVAWLAPLPPRPAPVATAAAGAGPRATAPAAGDAGRAAVSAASAHAPFTAGGIAAVRGAALPAGTALPADDALRSDAALPTGAVLPSRARAGSAAAGRPQPGGSGYGLGVVLVLLLAGAGAFLLMAGHQARSRLAPSRSVAVPRVEAPAPAPAPAPTPAPAASPPMIEDACTVFAGRMPADAAIVAGGAYQGRPLGFHLDRSGHAGTAFDVTVNLPGRDVVLVLGAYEPSAWRLRWTAGTRIAGVVATGYHVQRVIGLPADTPVLLTAYEDGRSACGYAYLTVDTGGEFDGFVRRVFKRPAQTYFHASDGTVTFGLPTTADALLGAGDGAFESLLDSALRPGGRDGLALLVREGRLRPADRDEAGRLLDAYRQARDTRRGGASATAPANERARHAAHVVLGAMEFPPGLHGAHSATFFVPRGVPRPTGDPGHSLVYDLNDGSCAGYRCD